MFTPALTQRGLMIRISVGFIQDVCIIMKRTSKVETKQKTMYFHRLKLKTIDLFFFSKSTRV